jgi:D-alanyl-D-alanine carboxypeptidase
MKIPPELRARMTSWHRGCPRPVSKLRLVRTSYWGLDGRAHQGKLIVAKRWGGPILRVLRRLYSIRFPIRRMRLPEAYGSDDDRLGDADVTSAFNCRFVEGTSTWSEHAYGRAIDINPRENPYVAGSHVSPKLGRWFLDRSKRRPGMIHSGDRVVRTFASIGWRWGGHWRYPKDYMHFSSSGR